MRYELFINPDDMLELSTLFHYASRLMGRMQHRQQHGQRGQHAQGKVLAIISENGPISQRELLQILDVRSSSLSELLHKLERSGLITRERSEEDRRSFIVSATKAADSLLLEREDNEREAAEELFCSLSSDERQALHGILLKMVGSMQDIPEPERGRGRGRGRGFHDGDEDRQRGRGQRHFGKGRRGRGRS